MNQFGSDGLIASASGPDLAGTAYALTNLTAGQVGRATARQAANALAGRVDDLVVDSGQDQPGPLARLILAAEATGMDPRSFGGTNLVARLVATMQRTGHDRGLFGTPQSATFNGAFRQGLALAALSLVRPRPAVLGPTNGSVDSAPPVAWLRSQQCPDGSWAAYRSDLNAPCAFDPVTFTGSDTNSTAEAVLGLQAVHASGGSAARSWFAMVRSTDGGWSFSGDRAMPADPDSTGLVLAALHSLGTPGDTRAVTRLLQFQFGPDSSGADRGAFWFPPFDASPPKPSLLATNDALVGLAPGVWPGVVER